MRKRRKKQSRLPAIIMMFFMVFILVGSFLTVILYAPQTSLAHNGQTYEFDQSLGMIVTEVDGEEIRFHNQVTAAQTVPFDETALPLLDKPIIIVTFDPEDEQNLLYYDAVRYELALTFAGLAGGVLQESDVYELPVHDCSSATPELPVIKLAPGDAGVSVVDNCITVSGNESSLVLAKDAVLYRYYELI